MPLQKILGAKLWKVLGLLAVVLLTDAPVVFSQASDDGARAVPAKMPFQPSQLYAKDPVPLTPVQCGQCHTSIYHSLKDSGGRHRFECQHCHKQLHAYQPLKKNWDQVMPKCPDCHAGPAHNSDAFQDCSLCHTNPHQIKTPVRVTEKVSSSCSICHTTVVELLQKHPSAHSKVLCVSCHDQDSHGKVPSCSKCHQPHFPEQDFRSCARDCHPVHAPLEIRYKKEVAAGACGACHDKVYATWQLTPSRHARVNCAACHTRHGFIPDCRSCHSQPHSPNLLHRFPKCLLCHQDAHDPPVKRRSS